MLIVRLQKTREATTGSMRTDLRVLHPQIRELISAFRNGLIRALGESLVGAYVLGSAAFPRFEPHLADIDFHAAIRSPLGDRERRALLRLHRGLARKFQFGASLDGFYIPLNQAKSKRQPRRLVVVANGELGSEGKDEAWALHREHLYHGGYVALCGQDPRRIYPPASTAEIRTALDHELETAVRGARKHTAYAVLNLCRLVCTWTTGRVATSKQDAAGWARGRWPASWTPVIAAALKVYAGRETSREERLLRQSIDRFVEFAVREVAMARRSARTKLRQAR